MVDASEIAEEYPVDGVLVKGPRGMVRVLKAFRTVPMPVWRLVAGGYGIECSHSHLVGTPGGFVEARLLKPGDSVLVAGGTVVVEESADTGRVEQLYDITVDDPSGEFYSNGILSHNSTSFCARQLTFGCIVPGYRSLYVTPYFEQLSTYGERMFDMEGLVRYDAGKQNKYLKKYPNGSKIWMSYACESADQIRGKTVSECLIDECVAHDTLVSFKAKASSPAEDISISDVEVGGFVLGLSPKGFKSYVKVLDKVCKGQRDCWAVCTEGGRRVVATDNHKFKVSGGWKYTADIRREVQAGAGYSFVHIDAVDGQDRVVSVEYVGCVEVWDIEVGGMHVFFANGLAVHNCQNMNPELLPEILKTQQMSKFPMTIYSGTALDTETLLEQRWQMSSKGCFHVRSHDGKHWINLHDEEELFKVCSNPMHPVDYWTGKPLDVTNGLFVHENQQALESGDVGFHIPMIIVPSNCSGTQWAQIYDDVTNPHLPRKKVLQEVFGIAVGEGAREITEDDLKAICVLTDSRQTVLQKVRAGKYRTVVMGCDWGGSDYNRASGTKQSYTVVTILGLTFADKVEILWSKKYAGMDYRSIAGDFLRYYREYGCRAIASDYGGSAVYTMLIRDYVPWERHYIMQYDAPWCAPFKRANSDLANHYVVNRTEAVTNTFMDIKDCRLQAGPWNEMRAFLTDILAVRRVVSEQPSGKKYMLWQRNDSKPDDFLHALTFGLTLIKVYLGERVVTDPSVVSQIRGIMNGKAVQGGIQGMPPVISG